MSSEARELHRIISAIVRDMLDAYRIQARAGPVTDKALEQIVFRAAHSVVHSLSPYPAAQRAALLSNVVAPWLAPGNLRGGTRTREVSVKHPKE